MQRFAMVCASQFPTQRITHTAHGAVPCGRISVSRLLVAVYVKSCIYRWPIVLLTSSS
jgi:hypothetical protein